MIPFTIDVIYRRLCDAWDFYYVMEIGPNWTNWDGSKYKTKYVFSELVKEILKC